MTTNLFPAEFGRHWEDHTAQYHWDGHDDGLDFNVWVYRNVERDGERPGFTFVVQQMLPAIVNPDDDLDPASWGLRVFVDDGRVVDFEFTAGVIDGVAVVHPLAERVPLEAVGRDVYGTLMKSASQGFLTATGEELTYDLASGAWSVGG